MGILSLKELSAIHIIENDVKYSKNELIIDLHEYIENIKNLKRLFTFEHNDFKSDEKYLNYFLKFWNDLYVNFGNNKGIVKYYFPKIEELILRTSSCDNIKNYYYLNTKIFGKILGTLFFLKKLDKIKFEGNVLNNEIHISSYFKKILNLIYFCIDSPNIFKANILIKNTELYNIETLTTYISNFSELFILSRELVFNNNLSGIFLEHLHIKYNIPYKNFNNIYINHQTEKILKKVIKPISYNNYVRFISGKRTFFVPDYLENNIMRFTTFDIIFPEDLIINLCKKLYRFI